jgi:signal transduction histidine kinase
MDATPIATATRLIASERNKFVRSALASLLVLVGVASSEAQPAVRQVLLLQSFNRGNITLDYFTTNFRVELDQRSGTPVNVVQIIVGPTGFIGAPERETVDYIRSIFADRPKPDLIMTAAGPAAAFARRYRQQLFPERPLLFALTDQRFLDAPLGENETAVAVVNDYPQLINDILQLRPQTKQVFVISGAGVLSTFWRPVLENEFRRFDGRLRFLWSEELSLPEILRRSANLPSDSAIFFLTFGTDAQGGSYADERVLAELATAANAPIFGVQSPYLGFGVVGGAMMPIDVLARNSADVAVRILNGATPKSITVPLQRPGAPTFDWRQLRRWSIPESRLPPGSVVLYRHPSVWEEYKLTVVAAAGALLVQSVLIIGLLYQRRARQRAELESRQNLALAADANRRETMSALTSSIAHELGQPLSALMHNAQALQMMVTANRASSETIGEILSDIQAQGVRASLIVDRHRTMLRSHQMEKQPLDVHAVIEESLALVAHDMQAREVELTVTLSSNSCVISGDAVLLQQVLVNLLLNAIDAMADIPPARRRIRIRCDIRKANVEISVRDAGKGLAADVMSTLFKPFVTTKSHGLGIGLTIARTIINAHGGTIDVRNNSDGGATFTVTLPRSAAATVDSESPGDA